MNDKAFTVSGSNNVGNFGGNNDGNIGNNQANYGNYGRNRGHFITGSTQPPSWLKPKEEDIVIPAIVKSKAENVQSADSQQKNGSVKAVEQTREPDIFISYQWGKKPQIEALFSRLSSLGYHCWMDKYQMGGGDKLNEMIDRGIRNAKVIVSCVTPDYAKSDSCCREISLADALKKPIIPLRIHPMDWPPEGDLSMVLTQLVYIGFHEDQDPQMLCTGEKFEEILQQLNRYVDRPLKAPDAALSGLGSNKPDMNQADPAESSEPSPEIVDQDAEREKSKKNCAQKNRRKRNRKRLMPGGERKRECCLRRRRGLSSDI